jgi:hypothetical protein
MAVRKTTKVRSLQKQTPEADRIVANITHNGESAIEASVARNGFSPSFEQIQRRAYELFMARGATHGCDWADWFNAEQELTATSTAAH